MGWIKIIDLNKLAAGYTS